MIYFRGILSLLLILINSFVVSSQCLVKVISLPENTAQEASVFMASPLNEWNPNSLEYQLENTNGSYQIWIDQEVELLPFKFTLGSWDLVEVDENGNDIANRNISCLDNDTIEVRIEAWKDPQESIPYHRSSTMSYNVEMMSDSFYMPQLDRYRRIWIYLPPDYEIELEKEYEVIYMHDGQNLFDDQLSLFEEWRVDESLNEFFDEGQEVPIVIGIENGKELRSNEYSMNDIDSFKIRGEGKQYLAFIVETLIPYVESHFRVRSGMQYRNIMGSSLGGLISFYAMIKYPEHFGRVGIFSPAYWIDSAIVYMEFPNLEKVKVYQIGGDLEEGMSFQIMKVDSLLQSKANVKDIQSLTIEGAEHKEKYWADMFKMAFEYFYIEEE